MLKQNILFRDSALAHQVYRKPNPEKQATDEWLPGGKRVEGGLNGKRGQLYGDSWELDFWW